MDKKKNFHEILASQDARMERIEKALNYLAEHLSLICSKPQLNTCEAINKINEILNPKE